MDPTLDPGQSLIAGCLLVLSAVLSWAALKGIALAKKHGLIANEKASREAAAWVVKQVVRYVEQTLRKQVPNAEKKAIAVTQVRASLPTIAAGKFSDDEIGVLVEAAVLELKSIAPPPLPSLPPVLSSPPAGAAAARVTFPKPTRLPDLPGELSRDEPG